MKTALRYLALLTLPLYLADQLTKWAVLRNLRFGEVYGVIPGFFDLVHVTNTGAAFGMMKDNNLFFIILSAAALVGLAWFGHKNAFDTAANRTAAALLTSGILGNLTDRLIHGHVIDFLDFYYANWHWPAFNVADSCICVAAGLFLIGSFRSAPQAVSPTETGS